jgi:hypothetical protein
MIMYGEVELCDVEDGSGADSLGLIPIFRNYSLYPDMWEVQRRRTRLSALAFEPTIALEPDHGHRPLS